MAQWVFLEGSQSGKKAAAVTLCAIFTAVDFKQRLLVCVCVRARACVVDFSFLLLLLLSAFFTDLVTNNRERCARAS